MEPAREILPTPIFSAIERERDPALDQDPPIGRRVSKALECGHE
jgi:hypothetical protein